MVQRACTCGKVVRGSKASFDGSPFLIDFSGDYDSDTLCIILTEAKKLYGDVRLKVCHNEFIAPRLLLAREQTSKGIRPPCCLSTPPESSFLATASKEQQSSHLHA